MVSHCTLNIFTSVHVELNIHEWNFSYYVFGVIGASPVPDRRRVPPDMYERYGGPPPHVMHHPREFRPPMHHESGK